MPAFKSPSSLDREAARGVSRLRHCDKVAQCLEARKKTQELTTHWPHPGAMPPLVMADHIEYTPVSPKRGRMVHATTLLAPTRTACGRKFSGWKVSLRRVTCRRCKLAIAFDCRPKRKKRTRQ